jgi:hypothetical protein
MRALSGAERRHVHDDRRLLSADDVAPPVDVREIVVHAGHCAARRVTGNV